MAEEAVNYLWDLSFQETINNSANLKAVKFELRNLCAELNGENKSQKRSRCQHCSNIWKEGDFRIRTKPAKKEKRSLKRLRNKPTETLNKFQKQFLKKFAQPFGNLMVIKCLICNKINKTKMMKPPEKKPEITTSIVDSAVPPTSNKKKKKKKDVTAGLKFSVLKTVSPHLLAPKNPGATSTGPKNKKSKKKKKSYGLDSGTNNIPKATSNSKVKKVKLSKKKKRFNNSLVNQFLASL